MCTTRPAVYFAIVVSLLASSAVASTYYVRTDGGSEQQCTGTINAAYSGSGTGQPCAWDHPFRALPPEGTPRIAGGDTLVIGAGSYMMGLGAPGAGLCEPTGPWGCHMPPIPSGPSTSAPTRIAGAGWDAGCRTPPELWGTERADFIVDLTRSSNVEVRCLEITDHSSCVESHSGSLACNRDTPPFGTWASIGIYAEDSQNVLLRDLDIHGLASGGVHAGRLTDWTVDNVRIAANGWVGWDGDIDGDDSNSGVLRFTRWVVEWNGCGETWPGKVPTGCWAQSAGGYGDGVGTGATRGRWIIEESKFLNNTSDGLDLLYARPGSSIEIRRTLAAGNAGNQLKTAGPAVIENSIIDANCGFHQGQPFTWNVDACRAGGDGVFILLFRGDRASVTNVSFTGEGDCLLVAECAEGQQCDGTERVTVRNNLFVGQTDYLQPFESTCLMYQETFPANPFDADYSLVIGTKDTTCPGLNDLCNQQPGVVNATMSNFDAHLLANSAAINRGTATGAPAIDFDGAPRDSAPDIGAYEYRKVGTGRRRAVRH
ncbi:MAG TPA: choice-of-anchor Q domain-containing protein [Thermoanaerobaculia bacterium]|nr:choice-of-anchor Q domain-containing protein [Thermoanaerobaculia bacterium]